MRVQNFLITFQRTFQREKKLLHIFLVQGADDKLGQFLGQVIK
jgi:hypothetical protein